MDFLKDQGNRIREQLAGLSSSQKMLAASLVVIMLMTLVWWSRYAGTSEMVALLEHDFDEQALSRATMLLKREQIPYKLVGKRIHVASDLQFQAMAHLGMEQLLPDDTSDAWEQIIEKMDSPWNPQSKQDEVFNHAKQVLLAQVLRAVPGVRRARVLIDNQKKRSFGEADREPTATVHLETKDGADADRSHKKLAHVAARIVAGAISGMKRSNVIVAIDGASYDIPDKDSDGFSVGADQVMEAIQSGERYYTHKVEKYLRQIHPGIMVVVTVDPKITSSQIERQEYDKNKTFDKPIDMIERTEENTSNVRPPAEPGAVPNVGSTGGANQALSIGAASGGGEGTSNTVTENKTKTQVFPSMVREWIKSPAGSIAVVSASVSVPRSYFVQLFRQAYPDGAKDPDEAALQPIIDNWLPKIQGLAHGALPNPEAKINMSMYSDTLPAGLPDLAAQPATATSIPLAAIRSYGREVALGTLAVFSLFMVSMMVRKSSPTAVAAPPAQRTPTVPMRMTEAIAAEAVQGDQTLEAVEIDDHAVKTQQMIGQVQSMVRENPDAAANLVKRWLNRA